MNENNQAQTEAVIELAQQLAVNNNTMSGAMRLISDNLEEVSSMCERVEDKVDDIGKISSDHHECWDEETSKQIKELVNKIDEICLLKFLAFIKKIMISSTVTIIVSGLIYISKTLISFIQVVQKIGTGGQ